MYCVIYRYENTIAGQFFGHAHSEELMIFYDEVDKQRPVSMVCMSFYLQYSQLNFYVNYYRLILVHQ